LDLSESDPNVLPFPSQQWNAALELITNQVTNIDYNNPNGSRLARVRTNERLLKGFCGACAVIPQWEKSNWQFRQFELDQSHFLQEALLTNTLADDENYMTNVTVTAPQASANYDAFHTNFIFSGINAQKIAHGQVNIPAQWLTAAANVYGEYSHYWALDPYYQPATVSDQQFRDIRQQISLNTCQGCHSGETKTLFTQVLPRGTGQEAKFWGSANQISYMSGYIEHHLQIGKENKGVTELSNGSKIQNRTLPRIPNGSVPPGTSYDENNSTPSEFRVPVVSAFLTGRNYYGPDVSGTVYVADDKVSTSDDQSDGQFANGLFYVADPYNDYNSTTHTPPGGSTRLNGYNDLEMRKTKLCQLVNMSCSTELTPIDLATRVLISATPGID
jgi:hypothetical protein